MPWDVGDDLIDPAAMSRHFDTLHLGPSGRVAMLGEQFVRDYPDNEMDERERQFRLPELESVSIKWTG